jgi:hypothetical protein
MVNALLIMQESLQNISAVMDKLLVLAEGETEE